MTNKSQNFNGYSFINAVTYFYLLKSLEYGRLYKDEERCDISKSISKGVKRHFLDNNDCNSDERGKVC